MVAKLRAVASCCELRGDFVSILWLWLGCGNRKKDFSYLYLAGGAGDQMEGLQLILAVII